MKNLLIIPIIIFFTSCQEVGDNKPMVNDSDEKQPIIIVNKNRQLNIAEFWIDKIEQPDEVIMNEKEIKRFNDNVAYKQKRLNYFHDTPETYSTSFVKEKILKSFKGIKLSTSYFEDGYKIPKNFYKDIKKEMNLDSLYKKEIETRYALTVNYTDQKIIPTELSLLKKKSQIHFDRNQNSALDIATPLAIIHSSKDGLWHYGIGPTSSGWVREKDIAFGDRDEILNYIDSKNFVVTTATKTPLMIQGKYHDYMRMGIRIPFLMSVDNMTMVMIPTRNKEGKLILANATLKTENVHKGYLPYTQRNILTQAFKFLHLPYGWGGMYGEQDCSKFLQEVYATTGIQIPRNSGAQSEVGEAKVELEGLAKKAKHHILKKIGFAGVSILHLKGHIVLYLGEYKDEPYIIHTVWGSSSKHFALGRTAVTSLNFNNYLNKIDRITNITLE